MCIDWCLRTYVKWIFMKIQFSLSWWSTFMEFQITSTKLRQCKRPWHAYVLFAYTHFCLMYYAFLFHDFQINNLEKWIFLGWPICFLTFKDCEGNANDRIIMILLKCKIIPCLITPSACHHELSKWAHVAWIHRDHFIEYPYLIWDDVIDIAERYIGIMQ